MINVEWLENGLYNIIKRAVLVVAGAMKAVTGSLLKNGSFVRAMSFRITTFFRHYVERSGDRTVLDECDEATNGKVKREIKNQRHSFVDCKEVPTTFTEEERKIILAHKKAVEVNVILYIFISAVSRSAERVAGKLPQVPERGPLLAVPRYYANFL